MLLFGLNHLYSSLLSQKDLKGKVGPQSAVATSWQTHRKLASARNAIKRCFCYGDLETIMSLLEHGISCKHCDPGSQSHGANTVTFLPPCCSVFLCAYSGKSIWLELYITSSIRKFIFFVFYPHNEQLSNNGV